MHQIGNCAKPEGWNGMGKNLVTTSSYLHEIDLLAVLLSMNAVIVHKISPSPVSQSLTPLKLWQTVQNVSACARDIRVVGQ